MALTAAGPLRRAVFAASWLPVALAVPAFLAAGSIPAPYRYLPLIASAVAFGMPHGAVDHLAVPRTAGADPGHRWFAAVGVLYALLGGAYAVVWFVAPLAAVVGFILLTWFHWGQGDLYALLALAGADHLDARPLRVLTVAVRGGLPMLVPLIAFPAVYRDVVAALVAPFAGDGPSLVAALFAPRTRALLGGGFAALTLIALAAGYARAGDRRAWLVDAGETVLLWAYFLSVPPVFAVGLYFSVWHSVRHIARLIAVDDRAATAAAAGRIGDALARFARDATPLTAAALALLGGLYLAVPDPPETVEGFVALYLVLIALLTLPHVAVVTWMDREQGVW